MKKYFLPFALCFLAIACNKQKAKSNLEIKAEVIFQEQAVIASLRGISVVDTNTIWLSGSKSTILRSKDGGENWKVISKPTQDILDFRDIYGFSAKEAIVVSAGFPSRVYQTVNGGEDWKLVHENLDSASFMNSVHFKDDEYGLIFGDILGERHLILRTLDRGSNWERIADTLLPKPLINEHGYAASGSCISVNSNNEFVIGLGGHVSRVFIEKESKWVAVETSLNGGGNSTGIYSIASTDSILLAVGGDYLKPDSSYQPTISFDAGQTWNTTTSSLNGYRSVVDYSKKYSTWIAAGINGLDLSSDNGLNWTYIKMEEINTLQFDPEGYYAWAAGPKGKIWKISLKD